MTDIEWIYGLGIKKHIRDAAAEPPGHFSGEETGLCGAPGDLAEYCALDPTDRPTCKRCLRLHEKRKES